MKTHNLDAFEKALIKMMEASMHSEFQNDGYGKAEADAAMMQIYGMTVSEFAKAYVDGLNLEKTYNQTVEQVL